MLLPKVSKAIADAPRYIAGVSFSDRTIRYVEVEKHKEGVLTISTFGQITIPYDVVQSGVVVNMVEFTETVRKLNVSIHPDAHIVLRKDSDPSKKDALAFAGYKNISEKEGLDSLRGVFIPWHTDAKRICLFANYDVTYVLEITGHETRLLEKFNKEDFFTSTTVRSLGAYLDIATDKVLLLAGKHKDSSFVDHLESSGLKIINTNIWQNILDFSVYVPEIPQDESYQYTVPVGLIVSGLMNEAVQVDLDNSLKKEKTISRKKVDRPGKIKSSTSKEERSSSPDNKPSDLASFLSDVKPLTKLEEDKRKSSEKKMSRKYKKLFSGN